MNSRRTVPIGIDLGTTFSLAAVFEPGGPRIIPNALGDILTPSAVHVDAKGRVLVGAAAAALAVVEPERTAMAFKRDMGTERVHTLGERSFRPEELSALVVSAVKADAEAHLGHAVEEAVVTVPAYFGETQRRATRDACDLANLHVERIINEPTAAALAYGLHERQREMRAVVLDLGGGTFDVTVLEILEGVIEIQACAGDIRLGGEDFVDALCDYVSEQYLLATKVDARSDRRSQARLREACERAKRRLSHVESTRLAFSCIDGTHKPLIDWEIALERAKVETVWEPLIERLRSPVLRALRDARVSPHQIDEVLLVGGATRMPCVSRITAEIFGRVPLRALPPDETVALGAAVQAALKLGDEAVSDMVVTDIAPFSMGIKVSQDAIGAKVSGIFAPILERGTVLPASRVKTFSTLSDGQRHIEVEIYQGENSLCASNTRIGGLNVEGIPPAKAGEQSIDVRFSYDMNGVLEVDVVITSTGKNRSLVIDRSKAGLSKRELEAARVRLKQLKFHPRDALPNVTALARGDALFAELTGPYRDLLGQALARLRAVLEIQDTTLIQVHRASLQDLITQLKREFEEK